MEFRGHLLGSTGALAVALLAAPAVFGQEASGEEGVIALPDWSYEELYTSGGAPRN